MPSLHGGNINGYLPLIRQRINEESDPIGFAISVMRGEKDFDVRIGGKKIKVSPTLDQRIECAKWLGNKILPDLKSVELSAAAPVDPNEDLLRMPEEQRMREIRRLLAVVGVGVDEE